MINLESFVKNGYCMFSLTNYSTSKILLPELDRYLEHSRKKTKKQIYTEAKLDLSLLPKTASMIAVLEDTLKEIFIMDPQNRFNFVQVRRYTKGTKGTSLHTSKIKTTFPLFILVLEDGGHFVISTSGKNNNSTTTIPATIGTVIMLNTYTKYCVRDVHQDRSVLMMQFIS